MVVVVVVVVAAFQQRERHVGDDAPSDWSPRARPGPGDGDAELGSQLSLQLSAAPHHHRRTLRLLDSPFIYTSLIPALSRTFSRFPNFEFVIFIFVLKKKEFSTKETQDQIYTSNI